jgi:MSHA biogenesis protein MshI
MATVRRTAGSGRELVSCHSVDGGRDEQKAVIAGWLSSERGDLGTVSSVLDGYDYQLLLVESPDVLPAELRAAVRWRLKDNIDFPVEDAVVDVFDIPEQTRRVGSKMMYTIAAKRQAIEYQVSLFKAAARNFEVIDIPEMALRNLASQLPEAPEGLILLWMSAESARLLVIKESTLYLTRHVQFSPGATEGDAEAAPDVSAIALELQRSMDYFESHYEQATIDHLIVAPVGAETDRLAKALASETSMRIQGLDIARAIDLAPGLSATDGRSLLAIGAALRDDQKKL